LKLNKIGGNMKIYLLTILPVVALLLFIGSCAQKVAFQRSQVVPAAEAEVRVKKDRNNNYELRIQVQNLAHPENLSPARDTYVVWLQSTDLEVYNLGELQVGNNLRGTLTTVTPHQPARIFITAEDRAIENEPGDLVVLVAEDF
jgi:hypothetical protein